MQRTRSFEGSPDTPFHNAEVPDALDILVLDGDSRQALAACRSLGALGHRVAVAGSPAKALAGYSRYATRYHQIPDARGSTAAYGDAISLLVDRQGYEVLIAVEDPSVAQLSVASFDVPTSPSLGPPLELLADKLMLADVAARANVAYPATSPWEEWTATAPSGFPVFVKPSRSAAVHAGAVRHHSGASLAADRATADAFATAIVAEGLQPIVQERIVRAEKINVTVFRRGDRSDVRFPYRVVRDVPLTGGVAVSLETVSAATGAGAEAVAALERVCDEAGYEGVANGEFCVAEPDGRLVLIEVNTRLWGSLWFAERLGQRVSERSVALALGQPVESAVPAPPGRRFHNPFGELRWILLHPQRRGPALEVLRSLRPRDVYDYFDRRDPGALARYAAVRLVGRFRSV